MKKLANERFAQKNEQFAHWLIFGERPERMAHVRSFLLSYLSDSLTSLIFFEQPERLAHIARFFNLQKNTKNTIFAKFF